VREEERCGYGKARACFIDVMLHSSKNYHRENATEPRWLPKDVAVAIFLFQKLKKSAAEFKPGCTSLEFDPCEGHPKTATPPDIIEQMQDMVLDDWLMKVCEIAETIGISKERVGYILHEQ
jgi:hypothetical protein